MNDRAAVNWLLASDEPAIRFLTRRDVLGEPAKEDERKILAGPMVTALLSGQQPNGGFGGNPYRKWIGTHWRLVSLVDFAVPSTDSRVAAAAEHELAWIARQAPYRDRPAEVGGLARICASVGANALAVSCRLNLAADPRARTVAETLIAAQWPDGGWNCDVRASGRRSSFHETLSTAWALHEYATATGDQAAEAAAQRAAELFLQHRLLYSLGTGAGASASGRRRQHRRPRGDVINPQWLELRWPSYWRYDILRALLILSRLGRISDPRAAHALDELERRRLPDGRWIADAQWWKPAGSGITPEVVDWGEPGQPNQMITLNALRVLRAAGRLDAY
jgi:hypothetical protein